jgi:hypothetical protein
MLWLGLIRESDQTLLASNLHHSANFLHFWRATRGYSAWNYNWVKFGSSCGFSPMFFGCNAFRRGAAYPAGRSLPSSPSLYRCSSTSPLLFALCTASLGLSSGHSTPFRQAKLKANHNNGQPRSAQHQIHAFELSLTVGEFFSPCNPSIPQSRHSADALSTDESSNSKYLTGPPRSRYAIPHTRQTSAA